MGFSSCGLSSTDLEKIRLRAERKDLNAGECVFSEGDEADYIYFIESGRVSIYIEKFTVKEEIHTLGPGDCLGEMAVFLNGKRTASAATVEDTVFMRVAKSDFLDLLQTDQEIAGNISALRAKRNEELTLRETLISSAGIDGKHLHVSIKGDPSLRETALFRERYESAVDKVLPQLVPRLEEMLLRRCVYQIYIGFNSGEIRTVTLLNPFFEEIHQVRKLLDEAYLDRHFPAIEYGEKAEAIRQMYRVVQTSDWFQGLPPQLKKLWDGCYENWKPIPASEISGTISRLPTLRSIQNYYLRNITISMIRDIIHMQFNCDGTHIVSAEDYERFLEENL
jgi:CRP-like cAMP-binding protein